MKSKGYKLYNKAQKKYIKEMKKLLKESGPFEWSYLWKAVGKMVKRRLDYFSDGYNVYQIDESANEIKEQLQTAMNLWNAAENFEYSDEKMIATMLKESKSVSLKEMMAGMQKLTEEERKIFVARTEEEAKQEHQAYKDFFLYLAEHLQEWWD